MPKKSKTSGRKWWEQRDLERREKSHIDDNVDGNENYLWPRAALDRQQQATLDVIMRPQRPNWKPYASVDIDAKARELEDRRLPWKGSAQSRGDDAQLIANAGTPSLPAFQRDAALREISAGRPSQFALDLEAEASAKHYLEGVKFNPLNGSSDQWDFQNPNKDWTAYRRSGYGVRGETIPGEKVVAYGGPQPFRTLRHELSHAWDAETGQNDKLQGWLADYARLPEEVRARVSSPIAAAEAVGEYPTPSQLGQMDPSPVAAQHDKDAADQYFGIAGRKPPYQRRISRNTMDAYYDGVKR